MTHYDLYAEVKCKRCGQMRQKAASFCPSCGYVVEESWWEKIVTVFRTVESPPGAEPRIGPIVSTVLGVLIAGYFVYNAIQTESLQGLIVALITIILALRSWFTSRNASRTSSAEKKEVTESMRLTEISRDSPAGGLFCENCGAAVTEEATACGKCGMKFSD